MPVPLDIVPNANPDPDVLVIHWEVYGNIKTLELQMDPYGAGCGTGATGFRKKVIFKEDHYEINRRFLPTGGYKLAFQALMGDGSVQRWGNLNFCGKG